MARQVNFWIVDEDLALLLHAVQQRTDAILVPEALETPELIEVRDPLDRTARGRWNSLALLRRCDIDKIVLTHVREAEYWHVDAQRSPAIQVDPGVRNPNEIVRGRLYFVPSYFDPDGHLVAKDADFVKWADSVLRWVRGNFHRPAGRAFYIGPAASALVAKGEVSKLTQ